eukprot:6762280-Pyramimonas_sp.AAC.1
MVLASNDASILSGVFTRCDPWATPRGGAPAGPPTSFGPPWPPPHAGPKRFEPMALGQARSEASLGSGADTPTGQQTLATSSEDLMHRTAMLRQQPDLAATGASTPFWTPRQRQAIGSPKSSPIAAPT